MSFRKNRWNPESQSSSSQQLVAGIVFSFSRCNKKKLLSTGIRKFPLKIYGIIMFSKPKYLQNGNTACVWDVSWNRTENVLSQVYSSQRGLPCELKTPVKSDVTVACWVATAAHWIGFCAVTGVKVLSLRFDMRVFRSTSGEHRWNCCHSLFCAVPEFFGRETKLDKSLGVRMNSTS